MEQCDEAAETHKAKPHTPLCCQSHMFPAVSDDGHASALCDALSVGGGLLKGQYVLENIVYTYL
jgi:hypothetical protein